MLYFCNIRILERKALSWRLFIDKHTRDYKRIVFLKREMSEVKGGNNLLSEGEDKHKGISDLSNFVFKRVLSDFGQRKNICVEGFFTDREGTAVVWLEKTPFNEDLVKQLSTNKSILKKEFINDIYGSYTCNVDPDLNGLLL